MTREEKIINEAKEHYSDNIKCYDAFLHGVEWADQYPNYENLWHDAGEEPKNDFEDILLIDAPGNVRIADFDMRIDIHPMGWQEYVEVEGVKK